MQYAIDVLDSGGRRTAELRGLVSARLREKMNGIGTLTVESLETRCWTAVEPGVSCLRIRPAPGSAATFRVIGAAHDRRRERRSLRITARHVLGDTGNELFADSAVCINHTPSAILARLLGHSAFSAGESAYTVPIPLVRFEYEPVFDCLMRLCDLTGGELRLDEDAGAIHLDAPATGGGRVVRYGVDLLAASREVDMSSLANRVYGVGGADPPLTLTGATHGGGMEYIEDTGSVAAYGIRTAVYRDTTIEDVTNLVRTPALDGVYTDGLCADWTNTGAAVSRNGDPAFIVYGVASQRVAATADGRGIEQAVTVTPGTAYSLAARVIVMSGAVRVQVVDGAAVYQRDEALTVPGPATVRIEDWTPSGGTVQVRIVQEGSGSVVFYVDSVQVNAGASARSFIAGSGADLLYERTVRYLETHCAPAVSCQVELINREDGGGVPVGPGDPVTLIDPTFGRPVRTRVMERDLDLLRPWRLDVRLDTAGIAG